MVLNKELADITHHRCGWLRGGKLCPQTRSSRFQQLVIPVSRSEIEQVHPRAISMINRNTFTRND